jgi:Lon protease-like protein
MFEKLPDQIPIFPLSGVIYFPKMNLPLNIFEQRYLDLVNDVIQKDKLMGMIQPKKSNKEVYKIGCLGKISDFQKSEDGRILINLTGLTRFEVLEEKENSKLYREFKVNYKKFILDLKPKKEEIDIEPLMNKVKTFFKKNGILLNWKEFDKLDKIQKINTLAMIAPITNEEKQKLLESITLQEKAKNLQDIMGFYLHETDSNNQTIQ